MNLWVRSQDKMKLLLNPKLAIIISGDVENGYSFDIYDTSAYNQEVNLRYAYLGTYNTKERALEVLDEIQDILNPKILIRMGENADVINAFMNNDKNDFMQGYDNGTVKNINDTFVYEMPKE